MAPNQLGNSSLYMSETNSADPVQIISKPGVQQDVQLVPQVKPKVKSPKPQYREPIVWRNVLIFIYLHISAFYGIYYLFTAQWKTLLWCYFTLTATAVGVTGGAHRLWAHRTYKAKLPLRIILAFLQTMALQNDLHEWVRDHRSHHKFTDTDADPHNSKRGFFFCHMGWLLVKKHQDVFTKGKTVDMSDVEADPVVKFQRKYYVILAPVLCFLFPAVVPWYYWNENAYVCWYTCAMFRYVLTLHGTWLVNSAAHIWGTKPYDKNVSPTENYAVGVLAFGEGWHNYHHVFPWDYKAAELGGFGTNLTAEVINFMAKIGWAYDLKCATAEMIRKRAERTGDGTKKYDHLSNEEDTSDLYKDNVWGWGDKDMQQDEMNMVEIRHIKST